MRIKIVTTCIIVILLNVLVLHLCNKEKNYVNEKDYIKHNIETIMKIQYRQANENKLSEISTSNFLKNLSEDFYKGFHFYTIDKNFMETCRKTEDGNIVISVKVEDARGSYIQVFTLTKNEKNKYLISDLQYDI